MVNLLCCSLIVASIYTTNPIYQNFSSDQEPISWDAFKSSPAEMIRSITVDFSVDERTWQQTAHAIHEFLPKIPFFPWAAHECVQYVAQRLIMIGVYPAQSKIMNLLDKGYHSMAYFAARIRTKTLDELRGQLLTVLERNEFITRHVTLQKNGITYSGLMIGHKDNIRNGKWVLQAAGNRSPVEYYALPPEMNFQDVRWGFVERFAEVGFNVLLVNPRGVGLSSGTATMANIGEGHELGLSFLETAVNAKKIVLAGHSIGGVAIADAVVKHEFKEGVEYHVISQQSLDGVRNVFNHTYPKWEFISGLISWAGCDTNAPIEAARKLSKLGIRQTVINAGAEGVYIHDGVIPEKAALGYRLQKEGIVEHKEFIYTKKSHAYPTHETIEAIRDWLLND